MSKKDAYIKTGSKLRRLRSGLCISCGLSRGDDGTETLCRKCADKSAERSREKISSRIPGRCAWCGEIIEDGVSGVFCIKHRERNRNNTRDRYKKYRDAGLCQKCGSRPAANPSAKSTLCEECWLKSYARRLLGNQSKWTELKEMYDSQGGLCAYSGAQITLGVDASLDHVLPISRFPVDKPDISQFKWVSTTVNYMKNNMTLDEWTSTMRKILNHMEKSHG